MAVQGKLVSQNPKDEPAKKLLEKIKQEKEKLIQEKKIKADKNPSFIFRGEDNLFYETINNTTKCIQEEIPFDIPDSWEWVRLGEIGITSTGTTPSTAKQEYYNGDIPFIGPADIDKMGSINYNTQKKLTELGLLHSRYAVEGSLLQVCIGGSIGKSAIIDRIVAFNQQINAIFPIIVTSYFLSVCFSSDYFVKQLIYNSSGTATPIINRTLWESLLIPLPPLEEQKRITQKITELQTILTPIQN